MGASLQNRNGLSADGAGTVDEVVGVTDGVQHGVSNLRAQVSVGVEAVAVTAFPVFHIAIGGAGLLHGVVVDESGNGDGALRFGLRVGERSANHLACTFDGDVALGIDEVGRAELRIGVRAQLLSPSGFGYCGLEQTGHHAALELGSGESLGSAAEIAAIGCVNQTNGSGCLCRFANGEGGVAAEHGMV